MGFNALAYTTIFQEQLDKQVVAQATSSWMEGNAGLVQYSGGNTIRIPKINMDGLANYDRSAGFVGGGVNLSYETMNMLMDRGRTFSLDAMDVNETNFVANASMVMSEFQRVQVIPEVDAYRYSKIAQLAIAAGRASGAYTPAVADVLTKIRADIAAIRDVVGAVPLVITMSTATLNILESSSELTKQLNLGQFNGVISQQVKMIDDCPIVEVPSARMKTSYTFNDGLTAGQTQGGFTPAAAAALAAAVTIGDVVYTAASTGVGGNAYSVTITQGTGAGVSTAGVISAGGALVITLGTDSASKPLVVTSAQIAALSFSGSGSALITAAAVSTKTRQGAVAITSFNGGDTANASGRNINWIISAQNAPIAVCKTDLVRIFTPDMNQSANAWKMDYRKYHDLWIPDNKMSAVWVNIKETLVA